MRPQMLKSLWFFLQELFCGKLNDLAVQQIALFREFESTMFPQKIVAAPHQQQDEVTT